jgi:hypothetical protein
MAVWEKGRWRHPSEADLQGKSRVKIVMWDEEIRRSRREFEHSRSLMLDKDCESYIIRFGGR